MFAAVPPRRFSNWLTRKETLIRCVLSGRMWSPNRPGKTMMVSKETEPVTAMRPMGARIRAAAYRGPTGDPWVRMGGVPLQQLPRPASGPAQPSLTTAEAAMAEAVEVYHRTYTTLLRSTGETRLRVLEASHRAMGSSLHSLAGSTEPDLGAFLYAVRRLPASVVRADRVVMGQAMEVFARNDFQLIDWAEASAPGRRRRWYDDGRGTLAVLIASETDVDDLIPTLVAFQIEWNKLRTSLSPAAIPEEPAPAWLSSVCGGREDDWTQLQEIWGAAFGERLRLIAARKKSIRVRMLGGPRVGYARVPRRWWQQVTGTMRSQSLLDRPLYFVSSNSHSLANLVTGVARHHEASLVEMVE